MAARENNIELPDKRDRDLIHDELDRTILVEAAAGTGKTTEMVGRMVALISEGKCEIDRLAAVTFTHKAAAELRGRFRVELEKAVLGADESRRKLLAAALSKVDRCFIGTIHSFCARLLRERPIEAGVDMDFNELDELDDERVRRRAWEEYSAKLYAENSPILDELHEAGLNISQLTKAFMKFTDYPDVDEWPASEVPLSNLVPMTKELVDYVRHMEKLVPTFPEDKGNDKLMFLYEKVVQKIKYADLKSPANLMDVFDIFTVKSKRNIIQGKWPKGKAQAVEEQARCENFVENVVEPFMTAMLEYRYKTVIRALEPAREEYDRLRSASGGLNFQDLLIKSAKLLRDDSKVREYFHDRFTHLLVDEFQDTDPIQAEVMLLLTADDPAEKDWRKCRPVGGSLFVVGDPKQSIYRFRRADVVTYKQVKKIIEESGGLTVKLSTNFRTVEPIIEWVNGTFESKFPQKENVYSPVYVPLSHGREEASTGELAGVKILQIPEGYTNRADIAEYEAGVLARTIRHAIDRKATVPRTRKELEDGIGPEAQPGDFLIITRNKKNLSIYSLKLQELNIPHQVTGGSAMNETPELELLRICLNAVIQPENPVALVAALRSELFGISDPALYAFKRAGGRFSYREGIPRDFDGDNAEDFKGSFDRLKKYARWLDKMPPAAAIENIVADLGLEVRACASPGGDLQAGALAKAIELLRFEQADHWSASELVEFLGRIIDQEEKYDGLPARSQEDSVVRVMNLHKVKGLEAPVVFLADPSGEWEHDVELHVDRSGPRIRGYLAVYGKARGREKAPFLAKPLGWDKLAREEKRFDDAEKQRLLYVAATRAGAQLTIAQREKGNDKNPWASFADRLADCLVLVDSEYKPVETKKITVKTQEVKSARADIGKKWAVTSRRTYYITAAKEISVKREGLYPASGEHGTEWGTVIHLLLQNAMEYPDADLGALAQAALIEEGLDPERAGEAIEIVKSVTRSQIWNRALASESRFVEVPFQTLEDPDVEEPKVIRGVIDLVFLEPEGWIVVDYKTDDTTKRSVDELIGHYRKQVEIYAREWSKCTGRQVHEKGLYFTKTDEYRKC